MIRRYVLIAPFPFMAVEHSLPSGFFQVGMASRLETYWARTRSSAGISNAKSANTEKSSDPCASFD